MAPQSLSEAFDPKNNSIGAIRLWCALTVITGHASPYGGFGDTFLMRVTEQQVSGARAAVDVFFVMSGFLLAGSWERSTPLGYIRNRILRIYPGLAVCLLLTAILVPLAFGMAPGWNYAARNIWLVFGLNHTIPGLFEDNRYTVVNGALWTLPWEVYCYISLPLFAMLTKLHRRASMVIFVALWVWFVIQIASAPLGSTRAITSPFRLFTFFYSGVLLWQYREKIPVDWRLFLACVAFLTATTALGVFTFRHPGGLFYATAPAVVAYLVIFVAIKLPLTRLNVENDISYGLYIYGTVAIQVLVALGLNVETVDYWTMASASVLVTLPFAITSWKLVEKPAINLRYATVGIGRRGFKERRLASRLP